MVALRRLSLEPQGFLGAMAVTSSPYWSWFLKMPISILDRFLTDTDKILDGFPEETRESIKNDLYLDLREDLRKLVEVYSENLHVDYIFPNTINLRN